MSLSQAYLRVAHRSLDAGNAALVEAIQEAAAFFGYHAFESCGGAFCAARGVPFPRRHSSKLDTFTKHARQERFARASIELAITLESLRNPCLYPAHRQDGTIGEPANVITAVQAKRLLGRIRTLIQQVERTL